MSVSFDVFTQAFLNKVTSYDFAEMDEDVFLGVADQYLFAACSEFERIFRRRSKRSFQDRDDEARVFNWDWPVIGSDDKCTEDGDYITKDEVVDIVSEGMLIRWLSGIIYSGDALDLGNFLATKDFTPYSPSSFLSMLRGLYDNAVARYRNLINEFSYNHGRLRALHM